MVQLSEHRAHTNHGADGQGHGADEGVERHSAGRHAACGAACPVAVDGNDPGEWVEYGT